MVTTQDTLFTHDINGRYICNTFDEAKHGADPTAFRPDGTPQSDARPFDIIVIGGGSFGPVFAQHLFSQDKMHSHRISCWMRARSRSPNTYRTIRCSGSIPPDRP